LLDKQVEAGNKGVQKYGKEGSIKKWARNNPIKYRLVKAGIGAGIKWLSVITLKCPI